MGWSEFSRTSYEATRKKVGLSSLTHVTKAAEQEAKKTGKLNTTVDPAVKPIRRSLMRMDPDGHGRFVVTMGPPMAVETTCDTTGSMGDNVDTMMKYLPDTYELLSAVLPDYDVQLAMGIFGDVEDDFVLQRPQFEMTAEAIVHYLKNMAPERQGGDAAEDPHYGLFAAAYLTDAYINRIGLKRYHFCVSDADAHDQFNPETLQRVFGEHVWDQVRENARTHNLSRALTAETVGNLSIADVVADLSQQAFCFFLQVGCSVSTRNFWSKIYGWNRVISIPDTRCLPQVQAAIVGLTEGTLSLDEIEEWLSKQGIAERYAVDLADQLSRIQLGAQAILRRALAHPLPRVGDLYQSKSDLWPIATAETAEETTAPNIEWL